MAGICTSPYPIKKVGDSPYPIKKVGDSPYLYSVNAEIFHQNGDEFG